MNKTDYEKLEKSLGVLREQYENYLRMNEQSLSDVNKRAIENSVVKCFEICYDTLWKHMKRHLKEKHGAVALENGPIPIFRDAHKSLLFDKETHRRLVQYHKIRNNAAHDYSVEKAMAALDKVGDFIHDAAEIYETMIEEE